MMSDTITPLRTLSPRHRGPHPGLRERRGATLALFLLAGAVTPPAMGQPATVRYEVIALNGDAVLDTAGNPVLDDAAVPLVLADLLSVHGPTIGPDGTVAFIEDQQFVWLKSIPGLGRRAEFVGRKSAVSSTPPLFTEAAEDWSLFVDGSGSVYGRASATGQHSPDDTEIWGDPTGTYSPRTSLGGFRQTDEGYRRNHLVANPSGLLAYINPAEDDPRSIYRGFGAKPALTEGDFADGTGQFGGFNQVLINAGEGVAFVGQLAATPTIGGVWRLLPDGTNELVARKGLAPTGGNFAVFGGIGLNTAGNVVFMHEDISHDTRIFFDAGTGGSPTVVAEAGVTPIANRSGTLISPFQDYLVPGSREDNIAINDADEIFYVSEMTNVTTGFVRTSGGTTVSLADTGMTRPGSTSSFIPIFESFSVNNAGQLVFSNYYTNHFYREVWACERDLSLVAVATHGQVIDAHLPGGAVQQFTVTEATIVQNVGSTTDGRRVSINDCQQVVFSASVGNGDTAIMIAHLDPCPADLALPFGVLDFSDVIAFLTAFGAQDPAADLAAPFGTFDFTDVLAFLAGWEDCPGSCLSTAIPPPAL